MWLAGAGWPQPTLVQGLRLGLVKARVSNSLARGKKSKKNLHHGFYIPLVDVNSHGFVINLINQK